MDTRKIIFYSILGVMTIGLSFIGYNVYKNWKADKDKKNGGNNNNSGDDSTTYNVTAKINVFLYKTPSYKSERSLELFHQGDKIGTVLKIDYDAATDETWIQVTGDEESGYAQKKSISIV